MSNFSNISNITSSNNFTEIGGVTYFLLYISDYLPSIAFVSCGVVIGFLGTVSVNV